ncbi:MAG: nucleotidyl transferase AbiEii/AbiGii toxin family protein [Gammaproteobacteria bacterium]|nr:nucleotidyl transferase AbiEii/AbiGii toxin family protein [Gammaproteobacteria bacterium]
MTALTLPAGPAALLDRTRKSLAAHLGGEHHLVLGGGTALIARWAHRWTHDLDFFIERASYSRLHENRIAFERDVRTAGAIRQLDIRPHNAVIVFEDGGEISLNTTRPYTHNPRSPEIVLGTAVALETTTEVLARKIGGRILGNNTFVPRDLYDIAVARDLDPVGLERTLKCFTPNRLQEIADELRSLPPDWITTHRAPLVAPTHPDPAHRAVHLVRSILRQPGRRWSTR